MIIQANETIPNLFHTLTDKSLQGERVIRNNFPLNEVELLIKIAHSMVIEL